MASSAKEQKVQDISLSYRLSGLRPFPDLLSSDSAVLRGLPVVFPLSLKGPHKGSLKNPVSRWRGFTTAPSNPISLSRALSFPLFISLSNHLSPHHPSVISCSSTATVDLSPFDLEPHGHRCLGAHRKFSDALSPQNCGKTKAQC
ncbi:hypothetical protein TNCV_2925331 [Trichonephila clavipes]|nr:hypothetical protein TNCV_2925331 [Trichonephila clavipes]